MHNLDKEISIWIKWENFSYKIRDLEETDVKVGVSDRVYEILKDYAKDHNFKNEELDHINHILGQVVISNMELFKDLLINNLK